MASSSSMTWTTPLSDGIADILLGHGAQREEEDRPAYWVGLDTNLPAMGLEDGAGDRQSDAHAVALVGDEWLKQLRRYFRWDPCAAVDAADRDHEIGRASCRERG